MINALKKFNMSMKKSYSPVKLSRAVLCVIALLIVIMLFVPPYLGLSNDGSFGNVLLDCGLSRTDPEDTEAYYNYYERTYIIEDHGTVPGTTPVTLKLMVRAAVLIDTIFTRDSLFDIRFLAALYLPLYLAALYPFLKSILERVPYYGEGLFLAFVFVIAAADVTAAVRLASFYTYPIELILYFALVDVCVMRPKQENEFLRPLLFTLFTVLLMLTKAYASVCGIVVSAGIWYLFFRSRDRLCRTLCVVCAAALAMGSVVFIGKMVNEQTKESKYDQMTRGVLFEAYDPEEALGEFGIPVRYAILADTYASQEFPVVLPSSGVLDDDFFSRYDAGSVTLYYIRHPGYMFALFNLGVQQAFITRSDYSGNYEKSAGLPAKAKSPFMSLWSTFKEQLAPNTAAAVIILVLILAVINRQKKTGNKEEDERVRKKKALIRMMAVLSAVYLLTVLTMSSDSELLNESYFFSVFIDVLFLTFISEVLHRLKIFAPGNGK